MYMLLFSLSTVQEECNFIQETRREAGGDIRRENWDPENDLLFHP